MRVFRPVALVGYPPSDGSSEQYDGLEAVPVTVRLTEIVDALEMQFDESPSYLDLDTGQVVNVSEDLLREAEEPGDEEPDLLIAYLMTL